MTDTAQIEGLLDRADDFDRAAQGILVALPSQMTEAAARLDAARLAFRTALHSYSLRSVAAAPKRTAP